MQISEQCLREFARLYEEHFGERLDDAELYDRATRTLALIAIVYGRESENIGPSNQAHDPSWTSN